jgi:hypothetical protein
VSCADKTDSLSLHFILLQKFIKLCIMKQFKSLLMFVAAGLFVAVCVINFKIGFVDYSKRNSSSMLTLEAMTSGEVGGNSSECATECATVITAERSLGTNCNCPPGVFKDYPRETIYSCSGKGGGICNPGSVLTYFRCDDKIDRTTDDRSTAYCPKD